MKILRYIHSLKKIAIKLILTLFAAWSSLATGGDILTTDKHAPCGELHLVGAISYITNKSPSSLMVRFASHAPEINFAKVNAGAVKYLASDLNGATVWRDNNDDGNYRDTKTYFIPVKAGETVEIAYCASETHKLSPMSGFVSFALDPNEAQPSAPANVVNPMSGRVSFASPPNEARNSVPGDHVNFRNWSNQGGSIGEMKFYPKDTYSSVFYNKTPDPRQHQNGSLTIF